MNRSNSASRETSAVDLAKEVTLDAEQKALARRLAEQTGVDFEKLRREELVASATGLVSPLDYLLWFVGGVVAGVGWVALCWWYFVRRLHDGGAVDLIELLVFVGALAFGLYIGACAVAWYAGRTSLSLVGESFRAVGDVKKELAAISPTALKNVDRGDLLRGTVWIVVLPVVEVVIRRRLKLKFAAMPANWTLRRVFRMILPPTAGSESDSTDVSVDEVAAVAEASTIDSTDTSELSEPEQRYQNSLTKTHRSVLVWGARVFGGIAILDAILIAVGCWALGSFAF